MTTPPKGWCSQCGDPWLPGQAACKKCSATEDRMKVCVKCPGAFTYLHPVMNFCPFCGNREIIMPGVAPTAASASGAPPVPATAQTAKSTVALPATSPTTSAAPAPPQSKPEPTPAQAPPVSATVAQVPQAPAPAEQRQIAIDEITKATGLSFLRARRVHDAGYDVPKLRASKMEDVMKIPGVDEATGRRIFEALGVAVEGPSPAARKVVEQSDDLKRTIDRMAAEGVAVDAVRGIHDQATLLNISGKHDDALLRLVEAKSVLNEIVEAEIRGSRERMLVRMSMSGYKKADARELREVLANIDVALSIGDFEEALELKRRGLRLVGEG